ncbi:MAG TPA: MBL fold metallo-hydrolase [Bacteroidales bacterium]|nr:MBL fold metallo-hydrolase [Bacteroidales bacterium]HPT02893.1 MBL fold metallo-hydrolase [Bacteroidales bacterium]
MPLHISSLNSGSNGNCYYIGNERDAVLIDAGISCRETERRMKRLGLSLEKVRAVFISHEHTDHTRGVEVLSRKHHLPVYISAPTYQNSYLKLDPALLKHFDALSPLKIGCLDICAFPKRHDASDPHSFTISHDGVTVGVMTDIGSPCEHVVQHFSRCHAVFLEANYDERMLDEGRYPYYLKKRISSDVGHLSNRQALELFRHHRPAFMTHLILSHLSKENNRPELVYELFGTHANGIQIAVASRFEESGLFCVG